MRALQVGVAAVVVAALACLPAAGDITVCQTFTNTTLLDPVNDLHWVFSPWTLTDNAWNGGAFPQLNRIKSEAANTVEYQFRGGNVAKGAQTTVSVTFDQDGYTQTPAMWSVGGVAVGQAGTPFSLRGEPGMTATEWVIALDNRDFATALQLIVSNLQFAASSVVYDANTLMGGTFAWSLPVPTFAINEGDERMFTVPTGVGAYPVLQGELMDANMPDTLCSFRAQITPEPATLALLGVGVAGLVARRRRK